MTIFFGPIPLERILKHPVVKPGDVWDAGHVPNQTRDDRENIALAGLRSVDLYRSKLNVRMRIR